MDPNPLVVEPTCLDTRGLLCPQPVIKLQEFVQQIDHDANVLVIATDPGVLEDIPMWCRVNGHEHVDSSQSGFEYRVTVRAHKAKN